MKDTIAAISTSLTASAIHIVRICGDDAFKIIQKIIKTKVIKKGYHVQKCFIYDHDDFIDEVILVKFLKPRSYNGENIVEINCHGGFLITNKILNLLIKNGARPAENGEFTKIGFLNNKISLKQSYAINNIINAKSNLALQISLNSFKQTDKNEFKNIFDKLFKLIGSIEVNIDYPEYDDVEQIEHQKIIRFIKEANAFFEQAVSNYKLSEKIYKGYNVAIIGKSNVGKSSLLNKILKEERAIVSNIAGTTRDVINEQILIKGLLINIIDTAGIRKTFDKIEKFGIKKSYHQLNTADLVLFVIDNSKKISLDESKIINNKKWKDKIILVQNKIDLKKQFNQTLKGIKISAKLENIEIIISQIYDFFIKNVDDIKSMNSILISNEQASMIEHILFVLNSIYDQCESKEPIDLIIQNLYIIHNILLKLLGEDKNFDFYEKLFKNFCIGK